MVSLQKGQTVSLEKKGGGTLTNVRMGLGWDPIKVKGMFGKEKEVSVDLDATAILFDASGRDVDTVFFNQLKSKDGSIRHTGDNLTGAGDGDDESIMVALDKVPSNVTQIVFIVNSYSGHTFDKIENASCRAVDSDAGDTELCRYELSGGQKIQAMVMAKLVRQSNGWDFTAIGEPVTNGRRIGDVMPAAKAAL